MYRQAKLWLSWPLINIGARVRVASRSSANSSSTYTTVIGTKECKQRGWCWWEWERECSRANWLLQDGPLQTCCCCGVWVANSSATISTPCTTQALGAGRQAGFTLTCLGEIIFSEKHYAQILWVSKQKEGQETSKQSARLNGRKSCKMWSEPLKCVCCVCSLCEVPTAKISARKLPLPLRLLDSRFGGKDEPGALFVLIDGRHLFIRPSLRLLSFG